jgi:hypothetical protein
VAPIETLLYFAKTGGFPPIENGGLLSGEFPDLKCPSLTKGSKGGVPFENTGTPIGEVSL